jgi:hypothetical protein
MSVMKRGGSVHAAILLLQPWCTIFATWYLHYLFFQLELNWIRIGFQVAVVEKISHTFLSWSNPMK